jgi:hypothetical protein
MIRLTQGAGRFSQLFSVPYGWKAASRRTMTFSTTVICIIISSSTVKQARALKGNGFVTLPTK